MRDTPLSYIQQRERDEAQLQVRRTTGGYYVAAVRGTKDRGLTLNSVALRQDEINALAQFLDHWRTDGIKRNAFPTDRQVDEWLGVKVKELKRKRQI